MVTQFKIRKVRMLVEGLRITYDITIGIRPFDGQFNIVIEKRLSELCMNFKAVCNPSVTWLADICS